MSWQRITKRIYDEVDRMLVVSYTSGSEIQVHRSASDTPDILGIERRSRQLFLQLQNAEEIKLNSYSCN